MSNNAVSYPRWQKQRVELTSTDWVAVAPPYSFDYVSFRCDTSAVVYRTNVDDADSEDTLPSTITDGIVGSGAAGTIPPISRFMEDRSRFPVGQTVFYAKSVKPTATLLVTWVL